MTFLCNDLFSVICAHLYLKSIAQSGLIFRHRMKELREVNLKGVSCMEDRKNYMIKDSNKSRAKLLTALRNEVS